ncbi:MAG: DUF2911 domain-containing protein [Cyclobacteriaceae bacterium]
MKKTRLGLLALTLVGVVLSTVVVAQKDKSKRPSPPAVAKGKIGGANILIDYSSPAVKGRKIWGDLVPFGKPWRAGANEATIFQTDKDIKVEGKSLPAGKYTLFTVPNEKEWEVIFNSQTGQWGEDDNGNANFDPSKNVITVKVKPAKSASSNERLTYAVTDKGFALRWENLEVPVSVK